MDWLIVTQLVTWKSIRVINKSIYQYYIDYYRLLPLHQTNVECRPVGIHPSVRHIGQCSNTDVRFSIIRERHALS